MEMDYKKLVEKSDANWDLAADLRNKGLYNAAANRLYYAIFQIVKSYAVKIGKMKMDDRKDVHRIAKEIVKEENKDFGRTYGEAEDYRATADYCLEDIDKNDLDLSFVNNAQTLRDHYKKLVA